VLKGLKLHTSREGATAAALGEPNAEDNRPDTSGQATASNNPPANGGPVVLEEPIAVNPPANGTQAKIELYFFKKHAPALSRVLACVEDNPKDLYLDEEAFASFVYNCLSTTIKKGAWRIGRN